MPFAEADYLPSVEELTVPEINLSAAPLRAGAHHFGKYCDNQCKEFMLCMSEEKDPRKCLMEGKEVTRCGMEFFQKIKTHCAEEFTTYWKCLDHSSYDMNYKRCKNPQASFDKCVFDKLAQEKPELGYFSKVRIHDSIRPKPTRKLDLPEPTPGIDFSKRDELPKPDSVKLGARNPYWGK